MQANPTHRQREPFVMTPTALLYADVSDRAVRIWAILDDIARADPSVRLTLRSIAQLLGTSRRSTSNAVAELLRAGYLQRLPSDGGPSVYAPQHRPRPVSKPVENPAVDGENLGNMLPGLSPDLGNMLPGSLAVTLYSARARRREEATELSTGGCTDGDSRATTSRRPWCGQCEQRTRLLDEPDGSVRRCPSCHPLTEPRF